MFFFVGARDFDNDMAASRESRIKELFTINGRTAEVVLAPGKSLDRETQNSYVLVIKADDR